MLIAGATLDLRKPGFSRCRVLHPLVAVGDKTDIVTGAMVKVMLLALNQAVSVAKLNDNPDELLLSVLIPSALKRRAAVAVMAKR